MSRFDRLDPALSRDYCRGLRMRHSEPPARKGRCLDCDQPPMTAAQTVRHGAETGHRVSWKGHVQADADARHRQEQEAEPPRMWRARAEG